VGDLWWKSRALTEGVRAETATVLKIKDINTKQTENDSRLSLVNGA